MRKSKTLSKLTALALSVAMILTAMPVTAYTEEVVPLGITGEITAFAPLDESVANQSVPFGTAMGGLNLPDTLMAAVEFPAEENADEAEHETPATPVTKDISVPVTWESAPDYDGGTAGVYAFNAVIGGDYALAATPPSITVTVGGKPQAGVTRAPATPDYYLGDEDDAGSGKYPWSKVDDLVTALSDGKTIQITSAPGADATIALGTKDNITIIGMGGTNIPKLSITTNAANLTLDNISLTAVDDDNGVTFTSASTLTVKRTVSVTGNGENGLGICSSNALTINGDGTLYVTGSDGESMGSGGIDVDGSLSIEGTVEVIAEGGEGDNGGIGIFATGDITISSKTTAIGGKGTAAISAGGYGINSEGGVIINETAGEVIATGGSGTLLNNYGIYADSDITISAKTTATGGVYSPRGAVTINSTAREVIARGGTGTNVGAEGIYAKNDITISAQTTATGGISASGNGGNGIRSKSGNVIINAAAGEVTATGGISTGGNGGNGIKSDGGDITINSTAAEVIAEGGKGGTGAGGYGIYADNDITISSKTTATGGISDDDFGGNGIFSSSGNVIITAAAGEVKATGGNSGDVGGTGIFSSSGNVIINAAVGEVKAEGGASDTGNGGYGILAVGTVTISAKTTAKGGDTAGSLSGGGDGIYARGLITISAQTTATGGKGTVADSYGGYGIYSISGGVIITGEVIATGGSGEGGGSDGICAYGVTISAKTTATGGKGGSGNSGCGIYCNGDVTINSTAAEVIATGGDSACGGDGISASGDISISAKTTAKGGKGGSGGNGISIADGDVIIPARVTVEAKGGNGTQNDGYDFAFGETDGKIFVTENGATLIGSGRNFKGKIVLIGDASGITLNNINLTAQSGSDAPGILFGSANPNTLTVIGTVTAEGSGEGGDGVFALYASLEIKGSGTLIANGGTDSGIGDIGICAQGDLIISAKTTATGGGGSAYSGHGIYCGGDVTINQIAGEVKATAGSVTAGGNPSSEGIYAQGDITISAKTTATGGDNNGSGTAGNGIWGNGGIIINEEAVEVKATGGINNTGTGGNGGNGIFAIDDIAISAKTTATGGNGDLSGGNGILTFSGDISVSGVVTATGGDSNLPSQFVDGNAILIFDDNKSLTIEKAGEANAKLILTDGVFASKTFAPKNDPNLNLTMAAALAGKEQWIVTPASALIGGVKDTKAAVLTGESTIEVYVGTPKTNNANTGGGGGGGVATLTPSDTVNNQPGNITVTPTIDSSGTANTTVSAADTQKAVEAAVAAAEKSGEAPNVVITIPAVSGSIGEQTSVSATIPAEAMAALAGSENTSLTLNAPAVTLTFDSAAVQTIAGAADNGDVKINANITDTKTLTEEQQAQVGDRPVYDFSVTADGKPITDFNGNVEVSIPYTPKAGENPNAIVIYFVGSDGTLHCIENGSYDPATGKVSFTTNHFSLYMIGYNLVAFNDVPAGFWGKAVIEKSAARGLVSGVGGGSYDPGRAVSRGEFVQMVQNVLKLPSGSNSQGYADVKADAWYFNAVVSAKSAGLLDGLAAEGNNFMPNQPITREEMAVILANIAEYKGAEKTGATFDLNKFSDFDAIENDYLDELETAIKLGLLSEYGVGGGKFDPKGVTTRAQAAQIQMNLLDIF